jgi:ABC-type sugar transport system ATPase subunit
MNFIDVTFNEQTGNRVEFDNYSFELTNELAEKIKNSNINQLILGIRPEHIRITPESHEKSVEVEVTVVEYLGAETLVTFELTKEVPALVSPTGFYPVKMGEKSFVSFPKEKIYIFNKSTGENILYKSKILK